jgi:hypothetical protein
VATGDLSNESKICVWNSKTFKIEYELKNKLKKGVYNLN